MAKIISVRVSSLILLLAMIVSGCAPAGPRALLKGKKYLDHGNYTAAAEEFKTATTLLATNANAWNYYGVALQGAGHLDDAASAYQRALNLDRDLSEAHLNLGNLRLEQNNAEGAKTEFTAYTLRRNNDPNGWLKLGSAQLKLGEIVAAEKSFSTVLALKPNDAAAYNGLGLARIQRGRPGDAAKFFAAAKEQQPDFAPAILNLATVNQEYLHNDQAALENYRAYLALKPRAPNWDEVNAIANNLNFTPAPVAVLPSVAPVPKPAPQATSPAPEPKPQPQPRVVSVPKPRAAPVIRSQPSPTVARESSLPERTVPTQVVSVTPAPKIVSAPRTQSQPATSSSRPLIAPMTEPPPSRKTGFWHHLFGSEKHTPPVQKYIQENNATTENASQNQSSSRPMETSAPSLDVKRYQYLSPAKPALGNRVAASGAFTKARLYEQDEDWVNALRWYKQAAQFDPSWFEAQYNTGVLAHRLRNYSVALPSYEYALAIQPDSTDARYNFALALKAAGYPLDAVDQLKKILAQDAGEVRAHLALANLYAQVLHDTTLAREHYLKVLELDPTNEQATEIHLWLTEHGK